MKGIHKTLTDDEGQTYKLVPANWVKMMTVLVFIELFGLAILLLVAITNRATITTLTNTNEIQRQRNLATDEMLLRRAEVQKWTYEQVCKLVIERGEKCYPDPRWWADRNKYPALVNDPDAQGSGLFPRDAQ